MEPAVDQSDYTLSHIAAGMCLKRIRGTQIAITQESARKSLRVKLDLNSVRGYKLFVES
jgi:hypothetical protein